MKRGCGDRYVCVCVEGRVSVGGGGCLMWGSTGLAWGGNQVRGGRTGGGSVHRNDQGQNRMVMEVG